jgi:hypothetical protein
MSEPASAPAAAVVYRPYPGEAALAPIAALVEGELSEPYVVYTYRYFLHQWSVRACRPPPSRALNACSAQAASVLSRACSCLRYTRRTC